MWYELVPLAIDVESQLPSANLRSSERLPPPNPVPDSQPSSPSLTEFARSPPALITPGAPGPGAFGWRKRGEEPKLEPTTRERKSKNWRG